MVDRDIAVLCGLSRFDSDNILDDCDSIDAAVYFDHNHWVTTLATMHLNEAFEEVERILREAGLKLVRSITPPWFVKDKVIGATVEQVQQALEKAQRIKIVTGQTQ